MSTPFDAGGSGGDAIVVQDIGYPSTNPAFLNPFALNVVTDSRRFPRWASHNPSAGVFDFTSDFYNAPNNYYNNANDAFTVWRANKKEIGITLKPNAPPAWTDQNDDAAWKAWATAVMKQWMPKWISFCNEPNGALDPAYVALRYQQGYAIAKSIKPDVIVVGPECESIVSGGNGVQFILDFLAAGGGQWIDVLGIHLYPYGTTIAGIKEPVSIITQMTFLLTSIAGKWKGPIWNTESGMLGLASPFNTYTLQQQTRWLYGHLLLPRVMGCARSMFYGNNEVDFGWLDSPYEPQLAQVVRNCQALSNVPLAQPPIISGASFTLIYPDRPPLVVT